MPDVYGNLTYWEFGEGLEIRNAERARADALVALWQPQPLTQQPIQAKHIDGLRILQFLASIDRWGCIFGTEFDNSVRIAMPPNVCEKLARAKMKSLMRRGLVDGCVCGCRGDFQLTDAGRIMALLGGLHEAAE